MAESGVKHNHFSLNRGIISLWAVTCRRCWISLKCLSPGWRIWAQGGYREMLAVLLAQKLPLCLATWLATETTSKVVQCVHQHHRAGNSLGAGKNTLAHVSWPDHAFLLCLPVHILLCSQDAAGKPSKAWVGICSWCKGISSVPCNKPGLVSQNVWCYPELCNQFEQSREGWNQLLVSLQSRLVLSCKLSPSFPCRWDITSELSPASSAPWLNQLHFFQLCKKQNFIIFFNFNGFLEGPAWVFLLLLLFFLFWPPVHSMPRPLSSTNIQGSSTRQAWTWIPMKEISPCETKIMMSIYSMAIILRNYR